MTRRDLRVAYGNRKLPFSPGQIVEALQGAGMMTDDALAVAGEVEKRLRGRPAAEVELEALQRLVASRVRERADDVVAQRYLAQTPPFVPIVVEHASGSTPFSRRTLMTSLEKLGLGFKEAHTLAHQVEQGLRAEGYEQVAQNQLAQRVASALESRYGRELRVRYEAAVDEPTDLMVVEEDGLALPYSRGILARSLMAVGIGPELSHQLAKRVEERLWREGKRRVERAEVRQRVVVLLEQEAGREFARRYQLLRTVRRPERPIVVLVGGTAGVGKSELAAELSYRLGIPRVVSSDAVRQALRSLISPQLSPVLHSSSYTAWRAELLPEERAGATVKRSRVVRGFQAQVQQLGPALEAIAARNVEEATSLVMEGVHLVPGLSPGHVDDATVVELMLKVEDEAVHRMHFGRREGQTDHRRSSNAYLHHFMEIRTVQDYLVARAEAAGVPVLEIGDFDRAVERAVEHVLDVVLASSDRDARELTGT